MTTTASIQLLNDVQRFLVDFANREGINLADDFETVGDFKQFVIGLTIKTLVDIGLSVSEAYDTAMGDGAYNALAERIWNDCQTA